MFSNQNKSVITALVTPFKQDHSIDYHSLFSLLDHQLAHDIDGLVLLGTTGESPTLTPHEKIDLIKKTVHRVNHQCPILIGTGSNATAFTVEMTKIAKEEGASGALIVTPYYNNPCPEEIFDHYECINDSTQFPFMLYHVPSRTNAKLTDSVVRRILDLKYCIGFKDASVNLKWLETIQTANDLFLSGDDLSAFNYCQIGGQGVISVISNAYPKLTKQYINHGDSTLIDILQAISCHVNPVPIKYLLKHMRLIQHDAVRAPLKTLNSNQNKQNIQDLIGEII